MASATSSAHSQILIIGAGIFGTSTAYHLSRISRSPCAITILDRAPFPSPQAASTDVNKIVRSDYSSSFYMSLAYEAMDAWASWPLFQEAQVYHKTGWVMVDEEASDLAQRIRFNFKQSGREDRSRDLSFEEVRNRWGGTLKDMDLSGFGRAYENPEAGWADAGLAVELMMKEAVENGVNYEVGEVERLVFADGRLKGAKTGDGKVYTADKIVLATGAWTSKIMSALEDDLGMPEEDRVERQVTAAGVCLAHFRLNEEEMKYYSQMPVLIYGSCGEVIPPTRDNLLKFTNAFSFKNTITTLSGHKISVPPLVDQSVVSDKLQAESLKIIKRRIPEILENNRQVDIWRLCWDAISPDQNQLITKHPHPKLGNLYLTVGGSFHSWKFLPIIGKYIIKVIDDESNGMEKDIAWGWKTIETRQARGVHEKALPQRELSDLE